MGYGNTLFQFDVNIKKSIQTVHYDTNCNRGMIDIVCAQTIK